MNVTNSRALPDPLVEPTISLTRAAAILGCGRSTVYDAARSGALPTIRVGARLLVPTARFLDHYQLTPAA